MKEKRPLKSRTAIRTLGAGIALASLLSIGTMPAHAAATCTWPSGTISSGTICAQPQLMVHQTPPYTVGTIVVIHGKGFEPGETVNILDRGGVHNMTAVANTGGMFNVDWAVPDFKPMAMTMFSAVGTVSNFETATTQIRQERALVSSGVGGLLQGWYPGEELLITLDGISQPSGIASAEGTSSPFKDAAGKLEVVGKQSGGFYARNATSGTGGGRPPSTVGPAPEEAPVVQEAPVLEFAVEIPAKPVQGVPEAAPVVKVPAPSRPQPQAAVSAHEEPGSIGFVLGGITALAAFAGLASIRASRRIRFATAKSQ